MFQTVLTICLLSFLAVLWFCTRKRALDVRPLLVRRHDEELGSYVLEYVTAQSKSGMLTFDRDIQGVLCRFACSFDESPDNHDEGIEHAIQKLRRFYSFAIHPERMKLYRNALLEVIEFHKTLWPQDRLDADEVRQSAQLINVEAIDEDAFFTFTTKAFMRGRLIKVRVRQDGDTDFVGVS